MQFTRLALENWRNFRQVDVVLQRRMFIVGPNAAGKSNLLDALRFLRDIAEPQGGFRRAVEHPTRRGVSQIRSLFARRQPNVVIEVEAQLDDQGVWSYRLEFGQNNQRVPVVKRELVKRGGSVVIERPDHQDRGDEGRLTQTYLEQVNANRPFRDFADFLGGIRYRHIVPQLVREPNRSVGRANDPYGGDFLEELARTNSKTLKSRLQRITKALGVAVPQLKELRLDRDERGVPHLSGLYEHWRPNAGWQTEEQFSDGTLRLLGLLWVFLDGDSPLLLEEPELSLHPGVVRFVPSMMERAARKRGRQVLVSTHSTDLLADEGIDASEVLLLEPAKEGTVARIGIEDGQIRALLEGGLSVGDAVMPRVAPRDARQLSLFGD